MINNILKNNLQCTGSPFVVTDKIKNTTTTPYSTGFLSYIMGPDQNHPNIIFQQVVTTKRGKGGKDRINSGILAYPIFKVKGVELDLMFPEKDKYPHFVDLDVFPETTVNLIGKNDPIDNNFLAWLLSKSLLINELDRSICSPDNKLMYEFNVAARQISAWPKDKSSKLKIFINSIEKLSDSGDTDNIYTLFSSEESKLDLLKEFREKEMYLLVPKLDYQRKSAHVILSALEWIEKFIKSNRPKIKEYDALLNTINEETKTLSKKIEYITSTISKRVDTVIRERILL